MFSPEYLPNYPLMIICTCLIYRIFRGCLTLRPQRIIRIIFFLILFCLSSPIILPGEVTATLGIFLFLALSVFLFCTDPILIKTAVTLILYPIWTAFYYLTENAGYVIWLHVFHQNLSTAEETLLSLCFYVLRIPFWLLIYRFTTRWLRPSYTNFSSRIWILISVICLASFLGIITLIVQADPYRTYIIWPACAACILTNMGICCLCAFIEQNTRAALEADVLRAQHSYYEDLKAEHLQTRKLRHDMKNHLSVIQSLLSQNKLQQADEYLRSLSRKIAPDLHQFCRQETVNALLNSKYHTARSYDIDCRFLLDLPEDTEFDPVDLCALIGNTLDNAIEASLRLAEPSRREILLKGRCEKGWLSYYIENSAAKIPAFSDSQVPGKKHGLGLQIVRSLVSRYNGTIQIQNKSDLFSVTILLPVPRKKEKEPYT